MAWPSLSSDHPLTLFHASLSAILTSAAHSQIWGVTLTITSPPDFSTLLILQKFLRAHSGSVEEAKKGLETTLKWRKEFGVDGSDWEEKVPKEGFERLGFVTKLRTTEGGKPEVCTWNVYGAVAKDPSVAFGDLDKFLRWRVDLMEQVVRQLHLESATKPIPDWSEDEEQRGVDPYQIYQVHDYLSTSFLRPNPSVSAVSKATIALLSAHYPELLAKKYFVNVPYLMGWVFSAVKLIVPKRTVAKFVVLPNGESLQAELGVKEDLPKEYGGTGKSLFELKC